MDRVGPAVDRSRIGPTGRQRRVGPTRPARRSRDSPTLAITSTARTVTTTKQRAGEQEEVDQLTAFRTGAFDSLDARNSSAP